MPLSRRRVLAALAVAAVSLSLTTAPAWSVVTTADTPTPPDASSTLYQVRDGDAAYVAPTNGYSDGGVTKYCLLTQDPAKATLTSVTAPDGNSYPLTAVYVGTAISSASGCIAANTTVFVDAGTYNSDLAYTGLSKANFSLVGLSKTSGEPAAKLVRTYSTGGATVVDQYRFINPDIHLENLILDGAGKNMFDQQARGWYAVVVASGAGNFVAKDVIIQNVGASTFSFSNRNSALQVQYDQSGTHHFVDLTVRNIKTTIVGAGVVFTNQSNKTYFQNLVMDATGAAANTYGPRVENSNLAQMPDVTQNSAVFAGSGTSIKTSTGADFIQVQDYRYDLIAAPAEYRYIEYTTHNANGSIGAYRIYKTLPAYTAGTAIFDRVDGYWIVQESLAQTATSQIEAIKNVRATMLGLTGPAMTAARVPGANIKIVPPASGELTSFTVADFGAGTPVTVVAVPNVTDLSTSTTQVPAAAGFTASLGATANSANVSLYNVDFASLASYTLHETIDGVTPGSVTVADPHDGAYPAGLNYADYLHAAAAALTGGVPVTSAALRNCTFVTLAAGQPSTIKALDLSVSASSVPVGSTATATGTVPSWYTAATAPTLGSTTGADDATVAYYSSDPSIATVDPTTGVITGVSPGSVTIFAKAIDKNNAGEIEKPFASAPFEVTWQPAIQITKTVDPLSGTPVYGTPVTYHFTVVNTGNIPLTTVGVTDAKVGAVTCAASSLAPAASTTCTAAAYLLTQADIDAGQVLNTAQASGTTTIADPATGAPAVVTSTSAASIDLLSAPAISLTKTATAPATDTAGATITYGFTVTNTGNVTLDPVTVTDPSLGPVTCPTGPLAPTASMTCTPITYTLTQADVDAGQLVNTATATGTAPATEAGPTPVTSESTVTTTLVAAPALSLVKTATLPAPVEAGASITYGFTVTNTGNVTLDPVTVTDPNLGPVTCPTGPLAPAASVTCTPITYTLTQADVDSGQLVNTATATGTPPATEAQPEPTPVTTESTVTTGLPAEASVSLTKTATVPATGTAGATITYGFTVTNTGNVTLNPVTVTDPTLGPVTCPTGPLAPGASVTCTPITYTLTQAEVDSGKLVNTATATGTPPATEAAPNPTPVTSESTVTTVIPADPGISLDATVSSPTTERSAGDTVVYTLVVTNTGNLTLIDVVVSDPVLGTITCPSSVLAPGESMTCMVSYILTPADIAAGKVTLDATATGFAAGPTHAKVVDRAVLMVPLDSTLPLDIDILPVTGATVTPVALGLAATSALAGLIFVIVGLVRRRRGSSTGA